MKIKTTQYQNEEKKPQLLVFASDSTGVAAEKLGLTIMKQFENYGIAHCETLPFIKTEEDAVLYAHTINGWQNAFNEVIVFSTFSDKKLQEIFTKKLTVSYFDLFQMILSTVAEKLDKKVMPLSIEKIPEKKEERAAAIDYALSFDDGQNLDFSQADIIILGLSRSGKTPTALWLALHYGLNAANYPITPDDFDKHKLPDSIINNLDKCVLLVTSPERLSQIRQERFKNSKYASLSNCQTELDLLNHLKHIKHIPRIDVSNKSVEEIAANALMLTNIHPKGRY